MGSLVFRCSHEKRLLYHLDAEASNYFMSDLYLPTGSVPGSITYKGLAEQLI